MASISASSVSMASIEILDEDYESRILSGPPGSSNLTIAESSDDEVFDSSSSSPSTDKEFSIRVLSGPEGASALAKIYPEMRDARGAQAFINRCVTAIGLTYYPHLQKLDEKLKLKEKEKKGIQVAERLKNISDKLKKILIQEKCDFHNPSSPYCSLKIRNKMKEEKKKKL
jgi:hypothetical protein